MRPAKNPRLRKAVFVWQPWIIFGLVIVVVAAILAFKFFEPVQVMPRLGLAPGYNLVNQAGFRIASEDYRGKVVFYNFTHTRCGEGCPQTTPQMEELRAALAEVEHKTPFALVTITVDPLYDIPKVMTRYASPFMRGIPGAPLWDFLTGDPAMIRRIVTGGFGVNYDDPVEAGAMVENLEPRYFLVDGWGIIRAVYTTAELDIPTVVKDFTTLESEIANSTGVGRYAYDAARLFRCFR